jgi:hypothetical protein
LPPPPPPAKTETKAKTETNSRIEKKTRLKEEAETTAEPIAPSFTLSASAGRRLPGEAVDFGGFEFKLAMGAKLTNFGRRGGHLWAELSGGIIGLADHGWEYDNGKGSATVIRSGGDLALLAGWPVGRGRLYAGPVGAIEFVWLEASYNNRIQRQIRTGLAAGLRTGYQLIWRRRFFARADLTGCAAIVRQKVVTQSRPDKALFAAPPAYATFSLGLGIWF